MKRIIGMALTMFLVILGIGIVTSGPTSAATGGDDASSCTPQDAYTETTDWVTTSPGDGWYQVDERTITDQEAYDETVVDQPAYDETVIDQAAVDKWYTWTGGPSDTHPWPSDNWNPDNGNHNGFPQDPGVYQRDKGNSGNSDWFYHEVVAEQSHVVHHDAVTHVVHHDAVTHQELKFAFDHPAITCPPPPPSDACPNLDGIQQDGFPCSKEPVVVNVSDSKSDCDGVFSREGTQTTTYEFVDGDWQASVGDPVWGNWTKVRDLTYQEQVEHQCTTPQPEAVVQETSSTSYHCGESHSTTTIVTTTTEYVSSDGGVTWTLGEPVTTTHTEQADHDVVACPGLPNGPKPPVTNVVDTLPTATLPTATLPNTGGPNRIALGLGLALLVLGGAAVVVSRRKTA